MVQFVGKYKQTKEENYEEFLKSMKLNGLLAKAARASTQTFEVVEDGPNKYKIVTSTIMKSAKESFEFGKTFDQETVDGRKVETTFTQDGDKWVQVQKNKKVGGPDVTTTRVFSDAGVNVTLKNGDVVAKIFFQRQ